MPPKAMKVSRQMVECGSHVERFNRLKCEVGGDYDSVASILKDYDEHFTKTGKYTFTLDAKHNNLFEHLLDCYADKKNVRINTVEVQKVGYETTEVVHYPKSSREFMRIIVIVKQRGYNQLGLVLKQKDDDILGHTIPIMVTNDGLYPLPVQMSEWSISSGNTIEGSRIKAARAIIVNMLVECLNDAPRATVANEFAGIEMRNGGTKAMDKIAQKMDEKGIDKQAVAEAMMKAADMKNDALAASIDVAPQPKVANEMLETVAQ